MTWLIGIAIYLFVLLCVWAFMRGRDERRGA